MSELQAFLTPEYMAIAVIAVLIIVAVFFAIVANKIIGVDSKMADLTDNIHVKVEKDITVLSQRLHDDLEERDAKHKAVLDNLGESWRGSLEKAVSEFRGETGKLKGEAAYNAENLRESMMKIISDNAVDFAEQIANVRDVNAKAVEDYQQNLSTQIRDNAAREHEEMTKALEAIAAAVDGNVTDLVENQKKSIEKVTKSVSSGYRQLAEKVEQDINASTGSASETLASVTKAISSGVEDASGSLNESLASMNKELDDNLTRINSRVNEALGAVATDMAGNFGTISERLNADIDSVTEKLDGGISDVSGRLNENIDSVNAKIDSGIASVNKKVADDLSAIGGQMGQGIDTLGQQIDANFDKVGAKVNKRIQKDMSDMHETFSNFAAKVDAIEQTRAHIAQLAENVSVLAQVLDDRRARGSLGEVLIESIVKDTLSPGDYELNAELSNGFKVDCLLKLPKPSGSIAISTKLDLSDLEVVLAPTAAAGEVKQAREAFGAKLAAAIDELAANAVIKDETAEGALLLLPSESAFSEAHVNHRALVDEAYKKQVWLASPSTLIAMVTVARAVIKDATARREIESLRAELAGVEADYDKLERNIAQLMRTSDDLLSLSTDTRKGARRISDRFGQLHSIIGTAPEAVKLPDGGAADDDDEQQPN
ncbi:MAG: DNA recombination protein RmuC [Betaproteobacteria bacterium AqS2]|uniref:DNA recombination protein RmuC n=1 Tax=Candidatus Amphirhobacter heronislandensis TaxID=1732024 RepID=A0A930UHL7_9GAMM|nr:DNA recombination protein RmuC [Betaproteobacteria bacterium AqS2]